MVGMETAAELRSGLRRASSATSSRSVAKARKVPLVPSALRRLRRRPRVLPAGPHPPDGATRSRNCSTTCGPACSRCCKQVNVTLRTDGGSPRSASPRWRAHPDRIDVRSPSEFADDHIPGAINLPVLDDVERAEIGTLHAQDVGVRGAQRGAAIVARNIARILEDHCQDKPREWAPLVYCWRGGKRSGVARACAEGNRLARRAARRRLPDVSPPRGRDARRRCRAQFRFVVVCGLTGSGKSRLLAALDGRRRAGRSTSKRSRMHRGSLLGDRPDDAAAVAEGVRHLCPRRTRALRSGATRVRGIGEPQDRHRAGAAMRCSPRCARAQCVRVATPQPLRVALLKEEYAHFLADPDALASACAHLDSAAWPQDDRALERTRARRRLRSAGRRTARAAITIPTYARSIERNFPRERAGADRHARGDFARGVPGASRSRSCTP